MSKLAHAGASRTTPAGRASPKAVPTASSSVFASYTATRPLGGAGTRRLGPADRPHRFRARLQRFTQTPEIAPLEPAPDDGDDVGGKAFYRPQRRLDVGRLRIVHEPDPVANTRQL